MMTLYMLVTKDKYELPLMVETSAIALARRTGVKANTIYRQIWGAKNLGIKSRYVRVEIPEEDSL